MTMRALHRRHYGPATQNLGQSLYATALPERYDIASGAYAFALIVTLAAAGEHSLPMLFARSWETVLGAALGLVSALVVFPLRPMAAGASPVSSTSQLSGRIDA